MDSPTGQRHNERFRSQWQNRVVQATVCEGESAGRTDWGGKGGTMADWHHIAGALVWCTVLALLIALAVYLLGRFRGRAEEDQPPASALLTKFREMHSQGGLSDEEFRTIKTLLAQRLHNELKDTSDKG
jgi:uncharacterized membrane protein